jgi:hypothetical protein
MQRTRRVRKQRGLYAHKRFRSQPVPPGVAPIGQCAGLTRLYSARSQTWSCVCVLRDAKSLLWTNLDLSNIFFLWPTELDLCCCSQSSLTPCAFVIQTSRQGPLLAFWLSSKLIAVICPWLHAVIQARCAAVPTKFCSYFLLVWSGSSTPLMQGRHICPQSESERAASFPGVVPVGPCVCRLSFLSRRRRPGYCW